MNIADTKSPTKWYLPTATTTPAVTITQPAIWFHEYFLPSKMAENTSCQTKKVCKKVILLQVAPIWDLKMKSETYEFSMNVLSCVLERQRS